MKSTAPDEPPSSPPPTAAGTGLGGAAASAGPIWVTEPFRLFFPLGIVAAVFGLLLWPMHYFGWWPIFPALQHPRLLIFGFGAAFVFGFLGTAWPRFLQADPLRRFEVVLLAVLWCVAQFYYARAAIRTGDSFAAAAFAWWLVVLGRRFFNPGRTELPAGFPIAFLSQVLALGVLVSWVAGGGRTSPEVDHFHRLLAYQGFLLLPLLAIGVHLFPHFLGENWEEDELPDRRRSRAVWIATGLVLASFAIEAFASVRWGNVLRIVAVVIWVAGALPQAFRGRANSTRLWALRFGIVLVASAFLCRAIWPHEVFAFEHILFLGGFSQLVLLVADRVVLGHSGELQNVPPRSPIWRWIVWLIFLTAATRAVADLVPSTRISHHIYAAVMLVAVLVIWLWPHARRLGRGPGKEDG